MSRLEKALDQLSETTGRRFENLESKIEKLTEVMAPIMLRQERVAGDVTRLDQANQRIGRQVDDIDKRVRVVEQSGASQGTATSNNEWITRWLMHIVVVGILLYIAFAK